MYIKIPFNVKVRRKILAYISLYIFPIEVMCISADPIWEDFFILIAHQTIIDRMKEKKEERFAKKIVKENFIASKLLRISCHLNLPMIYKKFSKSFYIIIRNLNQIFHYYHTSPLWIMVTLKNYSRSQRLAM